MWCFVVIVGWLHCFLCRVIFLVVVVGGFGSGRPKGSGLGNYTVSGAVRAKNVGACVSRRRKYELGVDGKLVTGRGSKGKVGSGVLSGVNDKGFLGVLDGLCEGDVELYDFYKQCLVDVSRSPSLFLVRKIAELEVVLLKRQREVGEGVVLSKDFKDCLRLLMQCVDTVRRSEDSLAKRGRGARRVMADVLDDDGVVLSVPSSVDDGGLLEEKKEEDDGGL